MSTKILIDEMTKTAEERSIDAKVEAVNAVGLPKKLKEGTPSVLLISPQIRYMKNEFTKRYSELFPVEVINMHDYGTMNGASKFDRVLDLVKKEA
jgi:PTS system cellobiose-specific IIB component